MEAVSKSNPEVSGKQKKRKSTNLENDLTSNDSHITKQNGKSSTSEGQNPRANSYGSGRKRRRNGEKKKACDLPKNPLSNSMIQDGSSQHAQVSCEKPAAAKLCQDPNFSTLEDATNMTSSKKKKKRNKRSKRKGKKESGVSTISKAEGLESVSIEVKGEGTDVKLSKTVSQTQSPKAKKRKRKRTKSVEVCDPLGSTLATSSQSGPIKCMGSDDINAGPELMSNLAVKRENSATGGDGSLQNPGNTKEKEKDENIEVNDEVPGEGLCDDVRSKKRKKKIKKSSSVDHKTADMEVCDPSGSGLLGIVESGSVECLLDRSNIDNVENCDGNAGQVSVSEATASKSEKIARTEESKLQNPRNDKEKTKDENVVFNQDALGAEGVGDSGRKSKRKKTNCESVANVDGVPAQCLLYHLNREGVENFDGGADEGIASKGLTSKSGDSANEGNSVRNAENNKKMKNPEKGEVDEDALGAEGVTKVKVKTKKMKNSLDQNPDNMEEKKEDIFVPMSGEGPKFDSSSVLIHSNVAQGVSLPQNGDIPRCSCGGQSTRKLAIFDLNGILADIVKGKTGSFVPDSRIFRSLFKRPFVANFLDFCFERFDVGIWSSRTRGLGYMINVVMGDRAKNLLFCFDQDMCITTKFKTLEDSRKPLFLKDLRRVWDRFGTCCTCGKRKYDETNTILVDDSPDKALCNPPHTGIFPYPYRYRNSKDSSLGPKGNLRKYLERLADAENVQKFVKENPFGQPAITETHKSWKFYSRVMRHHKVNHP